MNWRNLSIFGENKIINRSYVYLFIVPVLANFLSKVNSPLSLNFGGQDIVLVFELPFSWKMFFLSALLFSLASLFYNLFAPAVIKENKSYGDFIEQKKNFTHIFSYLNDFGINEIWFIGLGITTSSIRSSLMKTLGSYKRSKLHFINKRIETKLKLFHSIDSDLQNYSTTREYYQEQSFWSLYEFANRSRQIWLYSTSIFYLGGFVLISIVIFQGARIVFNI